MISLSLIRKEFFNYLTNFRYSVRLDKPLLTLRIIRNYLSVLIFKKTPLRYVDIALDYGCNLTCVHCSAEKLKKKKGVRKIKVNDYNKIAKQLHKQGVITVGFTGGEPLIYPHLEEAIKAFKPYKTMISIKTNGILLNDSWFEKLKSWKVDSISIGLGPVPNDMKDYDDIRGLPQSYQKSLGAVKNALNYGFRVLVGVVISHENIHSENVVKILEITKRMGVILIFGLAVPAGRWGANEQIVLTEEDRVVLHSLLKKYKHARTDFESNYIKRGCGAMNEKIYITPYGDVMPCPFLQIGFGNLFKERLNEIQARGLSYPILRGYPQRCLAADHYPFLNDCVSYTFNSEELPVYCEKITELNNFDEDGHEIS